MGDAMARLREEMEKKRKLKESLAAAPAEGAGDGEAPAKKKKVYLTNGQARQLQKEIKVGAASSAAVAASESAVLSPTQKEAVAEGSVKWIPSEEVVERLRDLKQPIRLFGESDELRIKRLRTVELSRPDDDDGGGQKNWQIEKMKAEKEKLAKGDSSDEEELTQEEKQQKRRDRLQKLIAAEEASAKGDDKEEFIKCWLKRCLKEWEIELEQIPPEGRRVVEIRKQFENFYQSKSYLKPLFKQLKKRSLELDIVAKLADIIVMCRAREYVKAADAYLLMSIGKAAWPMGVTMVGIHERSSREKIFSQDVAHILNDETQRKFIQSVKRLMTFSQKKYPPRSCTQALEPGVLDKGLRELAGAVDQAKDNSA
mmetsp:Transcript_34852/g.85738  ORF Transcript_34852/g.85738 Transcript_34852/m.85738 type:complete len:370 (+) Transcript_34852:18-1127(+)